MKTFSASLANCQTGTDYTLRLIRPTTVG